MTGSLDRTLETALADLIDTESGAATQCVPNLLGAGDDNAVLPRIVVTCERQQSLEFQRVPDGIYGLYPITTVVTCIAEATSEDSSDDMEEMITATDAVLIYNGGLASELTSGTLKVYGVVPKGIRQERKENRLIRHREILIWARLQPISSEAMLYEDGEEMLYEDGGVMFTE